MKTHYDRASSLHLCLGRIGSISSFTVRLYSLMAAGTQTARGGFMAPAAPLRLGEMSSLDCTSDTGGRRPGRYLDYCRSRLPDEETGQRGHARGRRERTDASPNPFICFICVPSGH